MEQSTLKMGFWRVPIDRSKDLVKAQNVAFLIMWRTSVLTIWHNGNKIWGENV